MKIKTWGCNSAVSEIIGAVLLLAIAVTAMSALYVQVLSDPGPNPQTFVTIAGKLDGSDAVFGHRNGETVDVNSEVMIYVYGQSLFTEPMPIYKLLNSQSNIEAWNIGEKFNLTIPGLGEGDDVQVEAKIVDKPTNSIIFWGVLKEGAVAPSFGRGGIWHFDESSWDNDPLTTEVKDSSGNGNHGSSCNGAEITINGKSNNAGYFDGLNDFVEVKSQYSLNLTKAITVEAWVKPLQETNSVVNNIGTVSYTHLTLPTKRIV